MPLEPQHDKRIVLDPLEAPLTQRLEQRGFSAGRVGMQAGAQASALGGPGH